jgi:prevent-host-death family protein
VSYNNLPVVVLLWRKGMKRMGIRELKARMSEAICEVQAGETIEVTNHGTVVALLVPVQPIGESQAQTTLRSLEALRAEIARHMTEPVDATQVLSDMRR